MADAIVEATNNWDDSDQLAEISKNVGSGMRGDANVSPPTKRNCKIAACRTDSRLRRAASTTGKRRITQMRRVV